VTSKSSQSARLALFALAMGGFAIGTTEFGTMGLLPYFSHSFGISAPQAGHVISAYALGVVVGAPVLAVCLARLPRRNVLVGLMLAFAAANGLSGFAPNYHWMLAFRFAAGLPHGAYFGVASLVAAELVPPARRAQAIARVLLGLTIATIIGADGELYRPDRRLALGLCVGGVTGTRHLPHGVPCGSAHARNAA